MDTDKHHSINVDAHIVFGDDDLSRDINNLLLRSVGGTNGVHKGDDKTQTAFKGAVVFTQALNHPLV